MPSVSIESTFLYSKISCISDMGETKATDTRSLPRVARRPLREQINLKHLAAFTQITVFVRIAEQGSMSAAARELNLSPSAVSKSLAQLEERRGVLLVKRTTRSLTPTDSGRIIFERANDILSDLETTLDAARQTKSPEGNLRVTCSMAFGSKQLTPIVGRYLDGLRTSVHPLHWMTGCPTSSKKTMTWRCG
ncbi:LysR family transcriptional regulator [Pandoraea terrae]|uniref:LysR family transcriptional regulator n=1 Tax=Pandoraea terrae TaxID=1537710 RepID=A0A5E4V9M3_9BURK|nr:LysR family transcriptional regulator [Pandoraea terrae]